MKTKEELNTIKEEIEILGKKLDELTDEELAQVSGGVGNSPKLISPILRLLESRPSGEGRKIKHIGSSFLGDCEDQD